MNHYHGSARNRQVVQDLMDMKTETPGQLKISEQKDVAEYITGLSSLRENLLVRRNLDDKLRLITDAIVAIFGADFARIWMIKTADLCEKGCIHAGVTEGPHVCRNRTLCLHLIASSGRYTHTDGGHRRVPMGAYKIGRVATGEESGFITNDVTSDPRVHDHAWARSLGLVSFAGFRLISSDGTPVGVLALFGTRAIEPREGKFLADLAGTTSQVIQTGAAEDALKRAYAGLEARVQERTAALRESEERLRLKLDSVLSPDTEIGDQDLINILDIRMIRSMMEDFTRLTGMVTAVLDLKGNIIVATGWQEICTKFHRVNPVTAQYCNESDLYLARTLKPGEYAAYKCKNNLWDVVTPLYIGNRHAGNIYTGQFFFDDETTDEAVFVAQAEKYGFNQEEYLAALRRVPRFSRGKINELMDFLVKMTGFISRLSYSNLKLAKAMAEEKRIGESLEQSERRLTDIISHLPDATLAINREGKVITWNKAIEEMTGVAAADILGKGNYEYALPFYGYRRPILVDWVFASDEELEKRYTIVKKEGDLIIAEADTVLPDGRTVSLWGKATPLYDEDGNKVGAIESIRDVTDRRRAEEELKKLYSELEQRVIGRTAELKKAEEAYRQANAKLNLLSSITRHDIRNQLLALKGWLELSKKDIGNKEKTAEFILREEQAVLAIERQISFTKEYEDLGVKAPIWQEADAHIRNAQKSLPMRDTRVVSEIPGLELFADPLLEKVFYNLIDNALRYGGLSMTTIRFSSVKSDAGLVISVEDDGEGITGEGKKHLFERGFGHNTGLGLFLSREILAITGITITENGKPGNGARFEITVPEGAWRIS